MTQDLDALERAARAATPGEWKRHDQYCELVCGEDGNALFDAASDILAAEADERNAAYLIAVQPATILSLISDYRALQERVEGAREALEQADFWLEGALNCKTWNWDDDQRAAATDSLAVIRAVRTKTGEPHEQG